VTLSAAQTVASGNSIKMNGGSLTDASGLTLNGTLALTGLGTVSANTTLSGTGTVTASGGTLDILGTVNSGIVAAIASSTPSVLKLDGTATLAAAVATFNNANQTLEIGASASVTINAAQTFTNGKIQVDGGTLTDASGLTVGNGAR
jgi:hypothetical protein